MSNIEWEVCDLELSKRLKELGFKQDSVWWWIDDKIWLKTTFGFVDNGCDQVDGGPYWFNDNELEGDIYAAYTCAELGRMLPYALWKKYNRLECYTDTEANARAKLLIYLAENKLIAPKTKGE